MANPKKCKNCGEPFKPVRPLQFLCKPACASEYKKSKEKSMPSEVKLSALEQLARTVFQMWIRLRDENQNCISCDKLSTKYDAGHYLKAELFSGLIFNETNCNKQCEECNRFLDGNEQNYRIGLIKKYGLNQVEALESTKSLNRYYKYSREEYQNIIDKYKQKIKLLTKK